MTTNPEAPAILRPPPHREGNWTWRLLACPHCGQQHTHGAPAGPNDKGGMRSPHCGASPHYRIVPAESTPKDAS